jgi:hypothetical protein
MRPTSPPRSPSANETAAGRASSVNSSPGDVAGQIAACKIGASMSKSSQKRVRSMGTS